MVASKVELMAEMWVVHMADSTASKTAELRARSKVASKAVQKAALTVVALG